MRQYQTTVSLHGKFLFRTDWDDDKQRVGAAAVAMATSMPLCKVETYWRDNVMRVIYRNDLLKD